MSTFRLAAAIVAGAAMFAVIVFWPAGTFAWPAGWIYVALAAGYMVGNLLYLQRVNPELIEARMRMGKGTKRWDIAWSIVFTPVFIVIYVVAGFDAVRFGWSQMSPGWWPVGLVLFVVGAVFLSWSMGVNPFFEKTVRIQTERNHHVIDTGPYALVRHPGYVGFFGWALSAPLLLGSWYAFLPAAVAVLSLVLRTALEDRTLRRELEGYQAYAGRTRYRLIPGIW